MQRLFLHSCLYWLDSVLGEEMRGYKVADILQKQYFINTVIIIIITTIAIIIQIAVHCLVDVWDAHP